MNPELLPDARRMVQSLSQSSLTPTQTSRELPALLALVSELVTAAEQAQEVALTNVLRMVRTASGLQLLLDAASGTIASISPSLSSLLRKSASSVDDQPLESIISLPTEYLERLSCPQAREQLASSERAHFENDIFLMGSEEDTHIRFQARALAIGNQVYWLLELEVVPKKDKPPEIGQEIQSALVRTCCHELHTPIVAISAMHDVLLADGVTEKQGEHLGVIQASIEEMGRLTHDLESLSHGEYGLVRAGAQVSTMASLVSRATQILQLRLMGMDIELESTILGDAEFEFVQSGELILRIMLALLKTALKFSNGQTVRHEVTVTAQAESAEIQLVIRHEQGGYHPTIATEILGAISGQIQQSRLAEPTSAGVNSYIAHELAKEVQGYLHPITKEGGELEGFQMRARVVAPASNEAQSNRQKPWQQTKAILVEPDAVIAVVVQKLLEHQGIEVTSTTDIEQIQRRVQSGQVQLLVLDVDGAGGPGRTVSRKLEEWDQGPAVLALTDDLLASPKEILSQKINAYLLKPIRSANLEGALVRLFPVSDMKPIAK